MPNFAPNPLPAFYQADEYTPNGPIILALLLSQATDRPPRFAVPSSNGPVHFPVVPLLQGARRIRQLFMTELSSVPCSQSTVTSVIVSIYRSEISMRLALGGFSNRFAGGFVVRHS